MLSIFIYPLSAKIRNAFSGLFDQYVVDGNDTLRMKLCFFLLLKLFDLNAIQFLLVPFGFGNESIETRLIGRVRWFPFSDRKKGTTSMYRQCIACAKKNVLAHLHPEPRDSADQDRFRTLRG